MRTRHTFTATIMVALLAVAGVTAAIAADPAQPPPPRIAFVANGRVPADALAAGPIAGQLGAPVYTTEQHALPDATSDALADYNPELVIIMGGTVAISDDVVNAIAAATGLPTVAPAPPPTTGVVRAAGQDRFITATIVADLLGAYDPAYLGVDLQAVDADLLDGMDSGAFQRSVIWANVASDGTIVDQSGGITMAADGSGGYYVDIGHDVSTRPIQASLRYANTGGETSVDGEIIAGACGTANVSCFVPGTNTPEHVYVRTGEPDGTATPKPFYLVIHP